MNLQEILQMPKTLLEQWRQKRNRKKAIRDQKKRARYMIEVDKLMEEWLSLMIINKNAQPQELQEMQRQLLVRRSSVKNQETFLRYLETIKK